MISLSPNQYFTSFKPFLLNLEIVKIFKFCISGKISNFMGKYLSRCHCTVLVYRISHTVYMRNGAKINILTYSLIPWKPASVVANFKMSNDFKRKRRLKPNQIVTDACRGKGFSPYHELIYKFPCASNGPKDTRFSIFRYESLTDIF